MDGWTVGWVYWGQQSGSRDRQGLQRGAGGVTEVKQMDIWGKEGLIKRIWVIAKNKSTLFQNMLADILYIQNADCPFYVETHFYPMCNLVPSVTLLATPADSIAFNPHFSSEQVYECNITITHQG